jgi:hypothetical protein
MNTTNITEKLLSRIKTHAQLVMDDLMDELTDTPCQEKEAILAGIEFEYWLMQSCRICIEENEYD